MANRCTPNNHDPWDGGILLPLDVWTFNECLPVGRAAGVLASVRRDGIEGRGGQWSTEEEDAFKAPIRKQYEEQGHPYFATARLWDDGVIDPADTRRVLALGLSASRNAPVADTQFGIFRM